MDIYLYIEVNLLYRDIYYIDGLVMKKPFAGLSFLGVDKIWWGYIMK